jgi:hypothetical protein
VVSASPLPLRVLVLGASTIYYMSWMGGPRSDFALPRAVEAELIRRGRPAEVRNASLLGTPVRSWFAQWETNVLQWSPDVIVAMAGHYEVIHLFLPHWFERHANRVDYRPGPIRTAYHRWVARASWKLSATLQATVDRRVGRLGLRERRLRRVSADLEQYIGLTQQVGSPMVILLEVLKPGSRVVPYFPGMPERVELLNEGISGLVDRLNLPHVRYFETSASAKRLYGDDQDAATPDGTHFTPELHREIAADLADRILEWADTQPHLSAAAPDESRVGDADL